MKTENQTARSARQVAEKAAVGLLVPGLALAATAGVALADVPATPATSDAGAQWTTVQASGVTQGTVVIEQQVRGTFAFDQTSVTPTWKIAQAFQKASAALCDGATEMTVKAPGDWTIAVGGDVANPYAATLDQIADNDGKQTVLMGCACAGNPADGRAAFNAQVTGVPLAQIIERAQPRAGVNTVTLVSEDGYRMSMPLDYVMARRALIASAINGEGLDASVGGTNQLWIAATAAKFFSRNIVAVELTCEDCLPAAPGTEDAPATQYANMPNVGVTGAA